MAASLFPTTLEALWPSLSRLPEGMAESRALIRVLDGCLHTGFSRLTDEHRGQLQRLGEAFRGSPLEARARTALEALQRGELLVTHFEAVAALRASMHGACLDALRGQVVPDRVDATPEPSTRRAAEDPLRESVQHWLAELALTGFAHLDRTTLQPFEATVEALQAAPSLHRLAALVTGVYEELLLTLPLPEAASPSLRLADLWTQTFLSSRFEAVEETLPLTQLTFTPLGAELQSHARYALLRVLGILTSQEHGPTLARMCVGTFKPEVFYGMEQWLLLKDRQGLLVEALAGHKCLHAAQGHLSLDGTVVPTGALSLGQEVSLADVLPQLAGAVPLPPAAAVLRHPIQLAEPLWLEGISLVEAADGLRVVQGEKALPVTRDRLPPDDPSVFKTLQTATALLGLLRYDQGRFQLQPLAARCGSGKKAKDVLLGESGLAYCLKDKRKSLPTLHERASRLLRQK